MKTMYCGWDGSRYGKDKPKIVILEKHQTHYRGFKLFDTEEAATAHYRASKAEAERLLVEHEIVVREHLDAIAKAGVDFGVWVRVADDTSLIYGHMVGVTVNNFYFEKHIE